MKRFMQYDVLLNFFIKALQNGGFRKTASTCEWDISHDCLDPYYQEFISRPNADYRGPRKWSDERFGGPVIARGRWSVYDGGQHMLRIILWTRCRNCEMCRKHRANLWRLRCTEEIRRSSRTWFGTMTFAPENLYLVIARARDIANRRRVSLESLPPPQRFSYIAKAAGEHVTKFMKRIRKNSGSKLRYVVVVEQHKSGDPHFHCLIHEVSDPVRWKVLSKAWDQGFSQFNLVQDKAAAGYVAKYLSKALLARVRASKGYGKL